MEKAIRYTVACLAVIFTLIVAASFQNYTKYYLKPKGDVLEVWKGRFSPVGEVRIAKLSGIVMPSTVKDIYTKAEALTLVVDYFISKADDLFGAEVPDLEQIQYVLSQAGAFAFTEEHRNAVDTRQTRAILMSTFYKVDAAVAKGSPVDFEKALKYLEEAEALHLTESQALIVDKRAEAIRGILQATEAEKAEASSDKREEEDIEPAGAAPEQAEGDGSAAPEESSPEKAQEADKLETTI